MDGAPLDGTPLDGCTFGLPFGVDGGGGIACLFGRGASTTAFDLVTPPFAVVWGVAFGFVEAEGAGTSRGGGICGSRDLRWPERLEGGAPLAAFEGAPFDPEAAFFAFFSRRPRFASARFSTGFSFGPGRKTLGFFDFSGADAFFADAFAGFFGAPTLDDAGFALGFLLGLAAEDLPTPPPALPARDADFFAPAFVLFRAMLPIAAPLRVPPTPICSMRGAAPRKGAPSPLESVRPHDKRGRTLRILCAPYSARI